MCRMRAPTKLILTVTGPRFSGGQIYKIWQIKFVCVPSANQITLCIVHTFRNRRKWNFFATLFRRVIACVKYEVTLSLAPRINVQYPRQESEQFGAGNFCYVSGSNSGLRSPISPES